jgi:mannose-1-phosphate guanylyltransferase
MKRLVIEKGQAIHYQYHNKKDETWLINKGVGLAIFNDESRLLSVGEVVHIPALTKHKILALEYLEIIETSTPELDDVVHLD